MAEESEHFLCPLCGMRAPVERVTQEGPFELRMFRKTWGGKVKLTEQTREMRRGMRFRRGSAPGAIMWEEIPIPDDIRQLVVQRIRELAEAEAE